MTICASCGKDIAEDMLFCPYCGMKRPPREKEAGAEGGGRIVSLLPGFLERPADNWNFVVVMLRENEFITIHEERPTPRGADIMPAGGLTELVSTATFTRADHARARRYLDMTVAELLANGPEVQRTALNDIRRARLVHSENEEYLLEMQTNEGSMRLRIPADHYFREELRLRLGIRLVW